MGEWIMDMARGEFGYREPGLELPEQPLVVEVEAGKTMQGSFLLRNKEGGPIKGTLHCTDGRLQFAQNYFVGTECVVAFAYCAEHLTVGESVKGKLGIVSDHGEYEVEYAVKVEAPSFSTANGKVKDVNGFAHLAKEHPEEAVRLFKSDEFASVCLYRDAFGDMLYRALLKGPTPSQAMEEFLIATRKKVRVKLELDKYQLEYKDCDKRFMDKVAISKNVWGYSEIRIKSDAEFLIPERKILWTDGFIGNSFSLEFMVDPDKMHKGKNYGKITFETVYQSMALQVSASLKAKGDFDPLRYKRRMAKHGITRNYIAFRANRIGRVEYVGQMRDLLRLYGEALDGGMVSLIHAHTDLIDGKEGAARAYVKEKLGKNTEYKIESPLDVLEYAGVLYVKALLTKEDADAKEAALQISRYYENGYADWRLLWFLLYVDKRYDKKELRLEAILEHVREGCCSPVLYFEAFHVLNAHPELLKDLGKDNLPLLKWGVEKGLCAEGLALRYTYQASRVKRFHPLLLRTLEALYGQYPKKEILTAICSLLIRSGKRDGKYFKWFQLGVEQQLKVTDVYEYYLYALDEESEVELPQSLLLYFMYDNHLNDKKKALLYARIIREKERYPLNYNNYRKIIEAFAKKQLEAGNVNANLATIYEDVLTRETLDANVAAWLPGVMFRREIACMNPRMVGACVVHREIEEEEFAPFVGGKAQLGVYTENAKVLLVDDKGCRYVEAMDYTESKLLHLDDLALPCYEAVGDDWKLRLFVFVKMETHYPISRDNFGLYRETLESLPLRAGYRKKILGVLIQYCYDNAEGELLGELLGDLDVAMAEPMERVRWAESFLMREMYPKAIECLETYGCEGIDLYRLGKLCAHMLLVSEEDKDGELLRLCHYLFHKLQYSEPILEYLVENLGGAGRDMLEVWKVSEGFGIDRRPLEERLLTQMLFTGDLVDEGIPVYQSYMGKGENRQLKKAYLSYLAYQNITKGMELPESVYDWMKKSVIYEENKACMLSLLRHYAKQDELDGKEKGFVEYNLAKFLDEDVILPFFLEFEEKIATPSKLRNVCVVDYVGNPNVPVTIRYQIEGDEREYREEMRNVFYGIYIKSCVLFPDETLHYRVLIEKEEEEREVKKGTLKPLKSRLEKMESNFSILNGILTAKEEKNLDKMSEYMERYLKRQYVMERLFEPRT